MKTQVFKYVINRLSYNWGEAISVLSLEGPYRKCPSLTALTRDIYDMVTVPQAIKLISPCPNYDNLYIQPYKSVYISGHMHIYIDLNLVTNYSCI